VNNVMQSLLQEAQRTLLDPEQRLFIGVTAAALLLITTTSYYFFSGPATTVPGEPITYSEIRNIQKNQAGGAYHLGLAKKYGRWNSVFVSGNVAFRSSDPEFNRVIWANDDMFHRTPNFRKALSGIGPMLIRIDGPIWKRHRQLVVRGFSMQNLRYGNKMVRRKCKSVFDSWSDNQVINTEHSCTLMSFDIILLSNFSYDAQASEGQSADIVESFRRFRYGFSRRLHTPWFLWRILLDDRKEFQESMDLFQNLIEDALKRKVNGESTREDESRDLIDILLASQQGDPSKALTNEEIVCEVFGNILAGTETTANTTAFLIYELARHQQVQSKLYDEVTQVIGDEEATMDKIVQCTYLDWVMREIQRLHPVVWMTNREVQKDFEYKGHRVKKGNLALIHIEGLHRDPEFFPDPLSFKPERWENAKEWLVPGSYIPFLDGGHRCPGERFAVMEVKTIIASLVREFKIVKVLDEETVEPKWEFTKNMKARVQMERRH